MVCSKKTKHAENHYWVLEVVVRNVDSQGECGK